MSASSERITLLIIDLENKIQEEKAAGRNADLLEEQVAKLRQELASLNEVLTAPGFVLKG